MGSASWNEENGISLPFAHSFCNKGPCPEDVHVHIVRVYSPCAIFLILPFLVRKPRRNKGTTTHFGGSTCVCLTTSRHSPRISGPTSSSSGSLSSKASAFSFSERSTEMLRKSCSSRTRNRAWLFVLGEAFVGLFGPRNKQETTHFWGCP